MFTKFSEIQNTNSTESIDDYLQKIMHKENMKIIFRLMN